MKRYVCTGLSNLAFYANAKKKAGKLGALPKRLEKLQLDIPFIKRKQFRAYVNKVNGFLMDSY